MYIVLSVELLGHFESGGRQITNYATAIFMFFQSFAPPLKFLIRANKTKNRLNLFSFREV